MGYHIYYCGELSQIVPPEGDIRHFLVGISVHHKTFGPEIILSITLIFVNVYFKIGNKIFSVK